MDVQQVSKNLAELLTQTLSPEQSIRKNAEDALLKLELVCPFYGMAALYLITQDDVQPVIKVSSSIAFKNYIKHYWRVDPNDESSDQIDRIDKNQRTLIKQNLTSIMLTSSKHIQRQLSESITLISQCDFPQEWPNLITELETRLKTDNDFTVMQGILQTAHSIFRRYRHELPSERLWLEIKLVVDHFAQPLTERFKNLYQNRENSTYALPIYQSLLLCVKIYHSLIIQDLPDFFEDHLKDWLDIFIELLQPENTNFSEDISLLAELKSEICEIASLLVQRYSDAEEVQKHTEKFAGAIWTLLITINQDTQFDILVSNAIQYLVTVSQREDMRKLYQEPKILDGLCERVIIPNMELRESDIELFEDNPDEYVKKDIEGSDVDTRRRAACDLVQTLGRFFEADLVKILSGYMNGIMTSYHENPSQNWKKKDLALYLFSSFAAKQSTRQHGVISVSQYVNIEDFLKNNILDELANDKGFQGSEILQSDALRYVVTFRYNISLEHLVQLLPSIIRLLASKDVVVRTYASITLEKLLTLRKNPQSNETAFKPEQFEPYLNELVNTLFKSLEKRGSEENEFIMKSIMRLFSFLKSNIIIQLLPIVVPKLTQKLAEVSKNPSRPNFNHYLFETLALTVRASSVQGSPFMNDFEAVLFDILEVVITQDIQEFVPYVLQLLNILLSAHEKNMVPQRFNKLFAEILGPALWEKPGNVRPLTDLTVNYVDKLSSSICSEGKLLAILGIFQKLISSKATDHEGLYLLQVLILHIPAAELDAHITNVFYLLFSRLSGSKTVKLVKNMIPCFALYAYVRGTEALASAVNKVQDRIFAMLIEKIFILEVKKITDNLDKKICVCGITKIISELPLIDNGIYNHLWLPLLQVLMEILELPAEVSKDDDEDYFIETDEIASSFQAQFSKLLYAGQKRIDPFKNITDLKTNLALSLNNLSTRLPGYLPTMLNEKLNPGLVSCLYGYCTKANVKFL